MITIHQADGFLEVQAKPAGSPLLAVAETSYSEKMEPTTWMKGGSDRETRD